MPRRRNPLATLVLTGVSLGFARLTKRLPLDAARAIGRAAASLSYYLVPRIRKVGLANLDLVFGDSLSRREKVRILKAAVRNTGIVAAEFSHIPEIRRQETEKWVRFEGIEHLDRNRGALIIGAHLGNWEWMGIALGSRGFRLAAVVRPLDNPKLNAAVEAIRAAGNVTLIAKDNAAAEVIRLLRENYCAGMLIDQSPRENGVPVHFLGQPAWATAGPAIVWARTRVPVHPIAMLRQPGGTYLLHVAPEIPMQRSGDLRSDILINTQRCQDAIEVLVRAWPEQWLWFHRRWKERPRLEREWRDREARRRPENP